jgi:deazaflavin-dependent oxidoreductase (nitroreductase family)
MSSPETDEPDCLPDQPLSEAVPRKHDTRGVSPIVYELFVLGELMVQPTYGYKLHETASRTLGPLRPLSWGVLYPLIRRLEKDGLTLSTVEKRLKGFPATECGQPRRIYTITHAGRQRFFDLMLISLEYSRDTPELFFIKLTKMQFLTTEQRIGVFQWYHRYVSELQRYYQSSRQEILSGVETTNEERPYILQFVDYRQYLLQAELAWLDNIIAIGVIAMLTVRGRKSGQPRTTPIAIVTRNDKRYLVATFGVANWVRNLRVAGKATLTYERRSEAVTAVELPPGEAAPILRECIASGQGLARLCFDATPTSPLQDFELEVPHHPVFQVEELAGVEHFL